MVQDRSVLVSLEPSFGNAPELFKIGRKSDVGALAEALVFYDRVYVNAQSSLQLYDVLEWFSNSDSADSFVSLLESGQVFFYFYNFWVNPIYDPRIDEFSLVNIQEPYNKRLDLFLRHVVGGHVDRYFDTRRRRKRFMSALDDGVIVVLSDEFGEAVRNAKEILSNTDIAKSFLQNLLDSIQGAGFLEQSPEVFADIITDARGKQRVHVNMNFEAIGLQIGEQYRFGRHTPVAIAASTNRTLWSAAKLRSDIYSTPPTYGFLCDKLSDVVEHFKGTKHNLRRLAAQVDFPDIREQVNSGTLSAHDILRIREAAEQFRQWFHTQTDRNRDIVQAYINDEVKRFGLSDSARKALKFSMYFAVEVGAAGLGAGFADATGAMFGAGGAAVVQEFMSDLYEKLIGDWRPTVVGNEMKRIAGKS